MDYPGVKANEDFQVGNVLHQHNRGESLSTIVDVKIMS